jgi:hypothetical protein
VGHGACGPETSSLPEAEGPDVPEGNNTPLPMGRPGEEGGVSGGCSTMAHRRGRSRNLGGPRLSSTNPGVAEHR